jgi:hypothetical protein
MKILKTTDIVTVKNNGLEVDLSPLSYGQSLEVESLNKINAGTVETDAFQRVGKIIKFAVKEIRGITDYTGNPIEIKSPNELTDDQLNIAITALSKSEIMGHISYVATSADLEFKELDGIEVLLNGDKVQLKK